MKEFSAKLSNSKKEFSFNVNHEYKSLKILSVIGNKSKSEILEDFHFRISFLDKKKKEISNFKKFYYTLEQLENEISIEFDKYFNNDVHKIIFLLEENIKETNYEFDFVFQYGELISIDNPIDDFKIHLEQNDNTKILFSAPFGSGKTFFLDHFFNLQQEEYEVFTVFPVNYSVASNEDIFKYIKTDILFQLLGRDNDFDKKSPKYSKTLPTFITKNIHKILAPFLIAIPKIGKDVYTVFQKLDELKEKYLEYHDSHNVDDLKDVNDYISAIYEQEGSLFEDDFYTQLIRQQLSQLKLNQAKENVLIIEDLDRMDPDHIFRILNVISAHYDTYHFSESEEGQHNKFGFDKIIVVCDVENIRNIFHHKYGEKTHFWGYMNKYFSSAPFHYNSIEMKNFYIEKNFTYNTMQGQRFKEIEYTNKFILKLLSFNDILSMRELEKFKHEILRSLYTYNAKSMVFYSTLMAPIIMFLYQYLGKTELIKKLKFCIEKKAEIIENRKLYHYYSLSLIAGLSESQGQDVDFVLNSVNCSYKIDYSNNDCEFYTAVEDKIKPGSFATLNDFYNLFILNIEKYDTLLLKEIHEK